MRLVEVPGGDPYATEKTTVTVTETCDVPALIGTAGLDDDEPAAAAAPSTGVFPVGDP